MMCIAFPKVSNSDSPKARWLEWLLLIPRSLALLWLLFKMLVQALLQRIRSS